MLQCVGEAGTSYRCTNWWCSVMRPSPGTFRKWSTDLALLVNTPQSQVHHGKPLSLAYAERCGFIRIRSQSSSDGNLREASALLRSVTSSKALSRTKRGARPPVFIFFSLVSTSFLRSLHSFGMRFRSHRGVDRVSRLFDRDGRPGILQGRSGRGATPPNGSVMGSPRGDTRIQIIQITVRRV